jgi:hypothetical protein
MHIWKQACSKLKIIFLICTILSYVSVDLSKVLRKLQFLNHGVICDTTICCSVRKVLVLRAVCELGDFFNLLHYTFIRTT